MFLDPGLGKTLCFLYAFSILKKKGFVDRAVIIAPLRVVYSVWPREIEKWGLDLTCAIIHDKGRDEALESNADILLINPEGLPLFTDKVIHEVKKGKKKGKKEVRYVPNGVITSILGEKKVMLIIDESSKFKNGTTERFKRLKPLLTMFRRRYVATGSPAPNGLTDLWGQMYCADLGATLTPFITHYRNRYFYKTGFGGFNYELQPGADKRIYKALKPACVRFSNKELKLPPIVPMPIYIDLDKEARHLYNEVERELMYEWDEGEIIASNAASASMKLRQITAGVAYGTRDQQRVIHTIHTAKVEALRDLIDELEGAQALIAYEFKPELALLREELKAPYIGGGVSGKKGDELVQQWNAGKLPQLIGNAQSMAYGLNMQEVKAAVIWQSLTWNLEWFEQFWQRVLRQGQKFPVPMYFMLVRNTIDEEIYDALQAKDRTQRALLDALEARFRKARTGA